MKMVSKSGICLGLAMCLIILGTCGCALEREPISEQLSYNAIKRYIKVDGDTSDWVGIKKNIVEGPEHLWLGQGMTTKMWRGNNDHSFSWKAAWFGDKFYFLIEVTDDNLQPCIRQYSWLNDCIEIQFDPKNLKGHRIENVRTTTPLADRIEKNLRGYEMHFLPCSPVRVYLSDVKAIYRLENAQNEMFVNEWSGLAETKRTHTGYVMEIGFCVPGVKLKPGMIMGVEIAVGDDDGNERKSLMLWTGKQVDFWITMDHYGQMRLIE